MTEVAGRRIATAEGAVLVAPTAAGRELGTATANPTIFDPGYWRTHGRLVEASRGRGSAWFVGDDHSDWVLRHYRRGGLASRVVADRYLWLGERRVRSFAEWRLLAALLAAGQPVAPPIAARYRRRGCWYDCDLITQRIAEARPFGERAAEGPPAVPLWRSVGEAVARLHAAGADHADLNAHNLLIDGRERVHFIDFDRGRLRPAARWRADRPDGWRRRNLERLRRSLRKIGVAVAGGAAPGEAEFDRLWNALLAGYDSAARDARGPTVR
ncbi:MAG: 3-deoxy-D-manno-octulosonic acid kinase [Gammaproteobacteria bacterium]|nr:3-deoxy-D-manno-octulosonic acid kinase [Gammaproteobacteria bacterium]